MKVKTVGIAWYKREDYETLKHMFMDGGKLPSTSDEWLEKTEGLADDLTRHGFAFEKVYINPGTFPAWCAATRLDIDAKARIRFSNESVA